MGLPFFPSDFPDCKAYSCYMTAKAASLDHKAEFCPPSIRPVKVPMPPPWAVVRISINKETGKVEVPKVSIGENAPSGNSSPNSCHDSFKTSSSECVDNLFDGSMARTGCMLISFLDEIKAGQLLLFPLVECDRGLYFQHPSSGNQGLNVPDDSIAKESHRWPIGFVTNPAIQGSKKLVAEGFCEAVLLARLREEQWKEKPPKRRKMEIYVLVRNPRSSVYRLALASIVLEHQENNVDFL